ncbi:MAG TPA: PASTA domain-containing protein, partial [Solirubrobacteraceae bacterium]
REPAPARRPAGPPRPRADGLGATRRAPALHPRRNLNPSARRRSIAALTGAFALLGAMIGGALVLGGSGSVRVPRLVALTGAQVRARLRPRALQPDFHRRHSGSVASGRVISENPRSGSVVQQGSTVQVVISSGPPPVRVPDLGGESTAQAERTLGTAGLRWRVRTTIAPQVPAGLVYSQSPAPGTMLSPAQPVILSVAEAPRWQPVTGVSGSGQATVASFRIRGPRWRVVYRMSYIGDCTFILFCSGPSAQVDRAATGTPVGSFGLTDGGRQTQQFATGPGTFRLRIAPGADAARWSAWVEDWY